MFSCLIPIMGFCVKEIVLVVLFLEPCLAGVTEVSREMPCLSRFERGVEQFFVSQIQEQILRERWSALEVQGPLSSFLTLQRSFQRKLPVPRVELLLQGEVQFSTQSICNSQLFSINTKVYYIYSSKGGIHYPDLQSHLIIIGTPIYTSRSTYLHVT